MASALRDLQLTAVSGGLRRPTEPITARDGADDLEDVRLLDSFDDEHRGDDADKLKTIQVKVTGMTCSACSNSVESAIAGVHGVHAATVSLLQNKAHVVFDPLLVKVFEFSFAFYFCFSTFISGWHSGSDSCLILGWFDGMELVVLLI